MLEVYTNKPFSKLHDTLDLVAGRLEPVWQSVPDPFSEEPVKGGPNISRATRQRIIELHQAGVRVGRIAKETGLSRETVRRWVKRFLGGKKAGGWPKTEITFAEVVTLEVPDFASHPEITYSVKYRNGHGNKPEGILAPGGSVKVKEGMVFSVSETGQS